VNHESKLAAAIGAAVMLTVTGMTTHAAEIRVLSTQATEEAYRELVPEFEKAAGHKVTTTFTGTLDANKRLAAGESYDLLIMSASSIDEHIKGGKVAPGSRVDLARVGIGVMVKEGEPKPDIGSVDAFKRALLAAKSVAYINPASGGSSGIYLVKLFDQLGIADQIKPKAKLKDGGYVAELIASGEAELGIHQISEIVPVKGVTLIGPLPKEIQNYTTYSAGISASPKEGEGAKALVKFLAGPRAGELLKAKGMETAGS